MAEEGLRKTPNDLIHIGSPIPFDADTFLQQMDPLMEAAYANREDIRALVADMVSTYHPAGEQHPVEPAPVRADRAREPVPAR